jgi:hypothetical protein
MHVSSINKTQLGTLNMDGDAVPWRDGEKMNRRKCGRQKFIGRKAGPTKHGLGI